MIKGLEFHHFGLAVKDPHKAISFLALIGYEIGDSVYDPKQKAILQLCVSDKMPAVELVYAKKTDNSPLKSILKTNDELCYHYCYSTENIENTVQILKQHSLKAICISKPKPAILFNNRNVAFYYIRGFGIIELLEIK